MPQVTAYLNFNGNCREAMSFYQQCLGGELSLQTLGEQVDMGQIPTQMKNVVLHATLFNQHLVLMGTDMLGDEGLTKGNAVSLMLHCDNQEEMSDFYQKLSFEGKQIQPIAKSIWGAWFGDLIDKFDIQWLLYCKQ
jgi:PhnB protein